MVKQKLKDVKKELDEEQNENYGEDTFAGSSPASGVVQEESTADMVRDVTGRAPQENIGETINQEEKDLQQE